MRKVPRQERSRRMVERILVAARDVLAREGYARFATNRVADEADVSPGSLYQYFGDKDELVAAVLDRYWTEVAERVTAALADRFGDPVDEMVHNTVESLLAALEQDSDLLRVAVEEIPASRMQDQRLALRRRVQELLAVYLGTRTGVGGRIPATAWVVVTAMEGLALRWVLDRPDLAREDVIEELTALAERYVGVAPGVDR